MAVYKRGETWWYSFLFAGRRIQESAKTKSKTVAKKAEQRRRRELEESFNAVGVSRSIRVRTVAEAAEAYQRGYGADHAPRSVKWVKQSLDPIVRVLGSRLVSDLTEERIREYMTIRKGEGVGNRLINMEIGNLSRAMGGKWAALWPTVRKLKEPRDIGRALTPKEEERLRAALIVCESDCAKVAVYVALNTGMRSDEIKRLQWRNIDFRERIVAVGESKTDAGRGRRIPINDELLAVLETHKDWYVRRFGKAAPAWYLFPWGQQGRRASGAKADPARPITTLRRAWDTIRDRAEVQCRFHDLRHTVCTKMAEAGVPESAMLAILGHVSRAMLERYSHIRIHAKREAVAVLSLQRKPDSKAVSTLSTTSEGTATVQ